MKNYTVGYQPSQPSEEELSVELREAEQRLKEIKKGFKKPNKITNKYKYCNHYHNITAKQNIVDFGTGKFIADKKRIALLKALNECGLITRTHCYGHETGYSFISILLDDNIEIEVRTVTEKHSSREYPIKLKELLITWKRID